MTLESEQDDDIPIETRRELMQCAVSNGRISYWYLCDLWRRGRRAGVSQVRSLLAVAAPEFCSNRCPSVFTKPSDPRHVAADCCQAFSARCASVGDSWLMDAVGRHAPAPADGPSTRDKKG
jgi:hypothetical protein